jgi:hypothetical protein
MWCSLTNRDLKTATSIQCHFLCWESDTVGSARPDQQKWLNRIIERGGQARNGEALQEKCKSFIVLSIPFDVEESQGEKGMGIDLGHRYLAVASVGTKPVL